MSKSADDYFDDGNRCELRGCLEEAIANYSQAIRIRPVFPAAYFNRAGDWELLGNYANAVADYKTAIEQMPNDPTAYESLALVYLDADDCEYVDPDLAHRYAERACELAEFKCFRVLATLARTCHACGWHSGAVRYQASAVKLARLQKAGTGQGIEAVARIDAELMLPELEARLEEYRVEAAQGGFVSQFLRRIGAWFVQG